MRRRRGETVVLTFSQQGWGNLSNTLCILLLLAMQGATGDVVTQKQVPGWGRAGWRQWWRAVVAGGLHASGLLLNVRHPGTAQAEITWRVQFAVGTAICLALVAYRWTLLKARTHGAGALACAAAPSWAAG